MAQKRKHSFPDNHPPSKRRKIHHPGANPNFDDNSDISDDNSDDYNDKIMNNKLSKKAKKALVKANETEAERRERRLEKKRIKFAKKKKNENENYFGYNNDDNPFGDNNLTQVFIWKKKYQQIGLNDKQIKNIQKKRIKDKQYILKQEILKTKQRRIQREKDKELEEKLHAELAKEMELEENAGWQEKEEKFHQQNAIKRSQIRINENREKAIDIVAVNISQFKIETKYHHKIINPVKLINNLELNELAELISDINSYIDNNLIEDNELKINHWKCALIYTQHIFNKKNMLLNDDDDDDNMNDINNDNDDIKLMNEIENKHLKNETYSQLCVFEDMCSKMVSGAAGDVNDIYKDISIDVNYWTIALKIAKIVKSKTYLIKEYNAFIDKLKKEKKEKLIKLQQNDLNLNNNNNDNDNNNNSSIIPQFSIPEMLEKEKINDNDIDMIDENHSLYAVYKTKAVDADDYWDEIEDLRLKVLKQSMEKLQKQAFYNKKKNDNIINNNDNNTDNTSNTDNIPVSTVTAAIPAAVSTVAADKLYNLEAARQMNDGEHAYNKSEISMPSELVTTYWWHDKYRPRKPRYFNRVKTGYSWNKYNQTHYDPDNPPPKIVQGYKFNIFYPDLIDSTKTPQYKLYEKDNSEYAILIFKSGPPYQDIAFKIVNNEWEPSHRRGFRCRFEKGIFSLYFNFKRYRYRR